MSGICCVVGGQFGSEGKGAIVKRLALDYNHHVRVGAANAGHTVYDHLGKKHVLQQLPVAAYVHPGAELYVGPGALISLEILEEELTSWRAWREKLDLEPKVVYVDRRAHVIQWFHKTLEESTDLEERIGSTSAIAREGIGAAQAARVMRESGCVMAEEFFEDVRSGESFWRGVELCDVPMTLAARESGDVLLEGTQGTGLSLTTGQFPFVTSRNVTAAGLLADAGLAPIDVDRVVLVCRTYPIRVAGASGPFWPDSQETTWESIDVNPEKEKTTVTKRVRRVATLSLDQLTEAATLNGATEIALTFCDYIDKWIFGLNTTETGATLNTDLEDLVLQIEEATGVPVCWLGTGPDSAIEMRKVNV